MWLFIIFQLNIYFLFLIFVSWTEQLFRVCILLCKSFTFLYSFHKLRYFGVYFQIFFISSFQVLLFISGLFIYLFFLNFFLLFLDSLNLPFNIIDFCFSSQSLFFIKSESFLPPLIRLQWLECNQTGREIWILIYSTEWITD